MDNVVEFIFELIFKRWIVRFLGLRTRYFFLSIFGKKVKLDELRGNVKDNSSQVGQDFLNASVGLVVFSLMIVLLLYLFFGLGSF